VSLLAATTVLTALPEFVIGLVLILVFGVTLKWLPIDSTALLFGSNLSTLSSYVLPVLTMTLVTSPYTVRIARSAIRESLAAPHTRAAILSGLSRRRVIWAYAVLPASGPIINTLALNLVYLISGVVVIENVFNFPGIGRRFVEAITTGDTVTVQAVAVLMGIMFIVINFTADMLPTLANPKLRFA
jgi:peptide/nickel transport system permease protein